MQSTRMISGRLMTAVLSLGAGAALIGCSDSPVGIAAMKPTSRVTVQTASGNSTDFNGFVAFCANADIDRSRLTHGGTVHFSGTGNVNQWTTGNPLIDGIETNDVAANINLKTGTGTAHIASSLKPDAVNGTWEIEYYVSISDVGPVITHAVGHGTGDLNSMTIKFTTDPTVVIDNVCNEGVPGGGAAVHGVIL